MFTLYGQYSDEALSSEAASVLFAAQNVTVRKTLAGVRLIGSIGAAPSWSSLVQTDFPYFHSPGLLCWFSRLSGWSLDGGCNKSMLRELPPALRTVQLFGRRFAETTLRYLGIGTVSFFGPAPSDASQLLIGYNVSPKLSPSAWIEFGGYDGWLIRIGDSEFTTSSGEDAAAFVQSHWAHESPCLRVTRFEGDILQAACNDQGQCVISYSPNANTPERFSGTYDPGAAWIGFTWEHGDTWEVPLSTVINREKALGIIRQFLYVGQ